jgi:alkylation response protein AidB-like acyl-CoA dehydrogenase
LGVDARELADEVLFPTANEVDALPIVPTERLDVLAEEGWYGLAAPAEYGGK